MFDKLSYKKANSMRLKFDDIQSFILLLLHNFIFPLKQVSSKSQKVTCMYKITILNCDSNLI